MKRLTQATCIGGLLGAATFLAFHLGAWICDRAYRTYDYCMRKRHS